LDLDHIPESSFGRRTTIYPGRADLEKIVASEISLDEELKVIVPHQATENVSHGSTYQSQSVTRLAYRSSDQGALEAVGSASARLSAISEYSTDEFGIENRSDTPQNNDNISTRPARNGQGKIHPASDGKMLILGEF
jgi:hypothetical protein